MGNNITDRSPYHQGPDPYTKCDLEFFLRFNKERYDLINYPVYIVLYLLFQFLGAWGYVFSALLLAANTIKWNYLGFRQMYASEGIRWWQFQ